MSKSGCFSRGGGEKNQTSLNELAAQNEERLMNDVNNFVNPNKEQVLKDLDKLFPASNRDTICNRLSSYFYFNRGNVKCDPFTVTCKTDCYTEDSEKLFKKIVDKNQVLINNVNENASSMEIYEFMMKRFDCFPMPESHSINGRRFSFYFPPHLFSLNKK